MIYWKDKGMDTKKVMEMNNEEFINYQLSKHPDFVSYQLNEYEIESLLSADYGIESKSGNKSVGKAIVKTINSFHIKKERECFYTQRVKDSVIKSLSQNKRLGGAVKMGIASNYVHQMIMYHIKTVLFYKMHPEYMELKK
jgi:hypothetical protein